MQSEYHTHTFMCVQKHEAAADADNNEYMMLVTCLL